MPKFITIGYGDQRGYDRTPHAIRDAAHRHDQTLRAAGVVMGMAGSPVQIRNPENAEVEVARGPYMASVLPVAGFAIVEAQSLSDAIDLVSKSPCAVAHGVVEVWPLVEICT
jgi:hypothetical protein